MIEDKKPSESEIKDFWKWCGFTTKKRYEDLPRGRVVILDYVSPNGKTLDDYPPIDLNNLFQYAIPQLVKTVGKHEAYLLISGCLSKHMLLGDSFEDELFWAVYWALDKVREDSNDR